MTVYAPDLYERKWRGYTPERAAFLREHSGIDAALLADSLGLSVRSVVRLQQKLGLRKILNHSDRRRE